MRQLTKNEKTRLRVALAFRHHLGRFRLVTVDENELDLDRVLETVPVPLCKREPIIFRPRKRTGPFGPLVEVPHIIIRSAASPDLFPVTTLSLVSP